MTMRNPAFFISTAAILLATAGFTSLAPDGELTVREGSRLWIQGSSTVNEWTCDAGAVEGTGAVAADAEAGYAARPRARLIVPVASFECGRSRMNRDFLEALKSQEHPEIVYELTGARMLDDSPSADGWYRLEVRGNLAIAGTTEAIETIAWGQRLDDGQFRIRGSKQLTMTEFGIQPPVALLGLVRAHDQIEVHFDLLAAPERLATR